MAPWQPLSAASRETFWRSLQTLNATRIVIALVLLVYLAVDARHGQGFSRLGGAVYAQTCVAYVMAALLFAGITQRWRRRFLWQLCCQILVDITVISLLYLAAGGARSGLGLLYLFPLAGAAILAPLILALFSASLATLFVLAESTYQIFISDQDPPLFQAGMTGAVFFAVVLVVSRLAARLIGQEELAARRGADLRVQQAVYRIVVDDAGDGILWWEATASSFPATRRRAACSGWTATATSAWPTSSRWNRWRRVSRPGSSPSRPKPTLPSSAGRTRPDRCAAASTSRCT
jgi:two-component system sensor histidine kinase PilS (NtrC family)